MFYTVWRFERDVFLRAEQRSEARMLIPLQTGFGDYSVTEWFEVG